MLDPSIRTGLPGQLADRLTVSMLGEVTARIGERALELGGRRQRAVLALLLIARGDVVPAERLVHALWGEHPTGAAAAAVQSYISHLRRNLEPHHGARSRRSVIVREGTGYAVRLPDDAVDAWLFESLVRQAAVPATTPADAVRLLAQALRLWRGPVLAEYAGEPWAEAEVARLAGLREVARERLVAARLGSGESAELVPEIEAMVAAEPLREERWRLLTLALYRAHRQGDALHALRRARQVLADELGIDPGPALRAMEAEVLAQSPALDAPATVGAVPAAATAHPDAVAGRPGPDDLVDREQELAHLGASVADALAGNGGFLVIEGAAGIGKTRLLTETRRLAARSRATVLTARASRLEHEYGFGVVRQLFEPVLATGAVADLPAAAAAVFDVAAIDSVQRGDGSLAVLHGLYRLTANLSADGPLAMVIDDLQWCDTASLRFLAYLGRRLDGSPVLVAATIRSGEPDADTALLAELVHDDATSRLRPGPLTPAGTAELVRRRLGPAEPEFLAACQRTTSGNPLLLGLLLRALQGAGIRPDDDHADAVTAIGSRAVSSLVLMRLARLPAAATATARAVAVLGGAATLPVVTALSGLGEPDVADAVAGLVRAEILSEDHPLGFVHPLVAEAVYRDLPPGERELCHERAARVLTAAAAPAEQVAAHLLLVPNRGDGWVVEVLRGASVRAADRGAPVEAAAYLVRALAEPPAGAERPQLLAEAGRLEAQHDGPAATGHLREAFETLAEPAARAEVALLLARTLVFAGQPGEAARFARDAVARLPATLIDEVQGLTAIRRIAGYVHALAPAPRSSAPLPQVTGTGPGARLLCAELAWEALMDGRDRRLAVERARFAVAGNVILDHDDGLLWVAAALVLELAGEDVLPFWDGALAHAHQRGSLFAALAAHLWRGYAQRRRGALHDAHRSVLTAREQSTRWGSVNTYQWADPFELAILVDLGQLGPARELVRARQDLPRSADGAWMFAEARTKLLLAEGRHAEALSCIDSVAHIWPHVANPAYYAWRSRRAAALAGLDRTGEAVALLDEELTLLRVWDEPAATARTLRLLGALRGADGEPQLREAVHLLAAGPARLEYARALAALAVHAPTDEAVPLLREAYLIAERCGAQAVSAVAADRLARAGGPVPHPGG